MKKSLIKAIYFVYSLYPLYIFINLIRYFGKHISPRAHVFFSKIHSHAEIMGCCLIENSAIDEFTRVSGDLVGINTTQIRHTTVGKFCSIGPNFFTLPQGHDYKNISTYSFFQDERDVITKPIHIENDVWIGANVTILGGVTVHDGVVIGAGSVVTKDCPPYSICVGNPAYVIKQRFATDKIERLLRLKWWDNKQLVEKVRNGQNVDIV